MYNHKKTYHMQFTLAEKMRIALDRSGYNYTEVSEATGMSTQAIRNILDGKAFFDSAIKLWDFLNLEVDDSKLNKK